MNTEFYQKLVDLYAGNELPEELNDELEDVAFQDPALSHDMATLRRTVDILKSTPSPEYTEESNQRILLKILGAGVDVQPRVAEPTHWQLQLPIRD